ncbi:TBC1 domain family member 2B-like [Orbicella faveolata]|uniref:TBC1 domain family member 2B-like n=1 Tax=Orbicella faveolata TaxID=48498 RepID=UPI0009E27929|nr:TBC1 domain family member 2B-like [Orbicella faveolata]
MEDSWELVSVPAEIQHSTAGKETPQDDSETSLEKNDGNNKSKKITSGTPKLCGFLNKLGAKGLKTWKTRWFVYEERKCKLYYYRTPQDVTPLGHIDLANASFTFDVEDADRLNGFKICTSGRIYQLQAKDKQTMMFWLQELQGRRREHSKKRANIVVQNKGDISALGQSTCGLLAEEEETEEENKDEAPLPIIEPVPAPESVGEEAATMKATSPGILSNFSFTNLVTEIKNINAKRSSVVLSQQPPLIISAPLMPDDDEEADESKSSFQSHIKIESPKPDTCQAQQENMDEKVKPFSSTFLKATTLRRKFGSMRTSGQPVVGGRTTSRCAECEKLEDALAAAETSLKSARDEIQVRQDVIESLHEHLRQFELEKSKRTQSSDEEQRSLSEEMKDKLIYISQLEERLKELTEELEKSDKVIKANDKELRECRDQIQMYQEMTAVKDQVVVSLTNQLYALEKSTVEGVEVQEFDEEDDGAIENTAPCKDTDPSSVERSIDEIQEIGKLKEACQAYVLQNRFLNSEILEFNKLRAHDSQILRAQAIRLATIEAEMCKCKSKYFLVLREFQKPRKDGENWGMDDEVISRLVEDAIDSESREVLTMSRSSIQPYDRWGFRQNLEGEDEEAFLSMAKKMDRRSEELRANISSHEMSVEVKWENFMIAHKNRELQKTPELKALVRIGVPHEHRATIWKYCIDQCVQETRNLAGDGYYAHLLENMKGKHSPAVKQIELDLLRTLPNNKHYDNLDADGTTKLREVLLAYSWHNLHVGYCQGLNRLVAIALLYLNEEESFWCLVAIVEHLLPRDYFSKTLIASQADQRVLRDLLAEKLPRLSAHFDALNVDLSLVSFNWFLTIFVDSFPVQSTLRVWDTFLFEGNKVLFRFALAVFKSSEEQLLKCQDHMSIFNFLRQMPEKVTDANNLSQIAFQLLNPFPMQKIRTKRAYHMDIVKRELAELDKLREDYVTSKADKPESRDGDMLGED